MRISFFKLIHIHYNSRGPGSHGSGYCTQNTSIDGSGNFERGLQPLMATFVHHSVRKGDCNPKISKVTSIIPRSERSTGASGNLIVRPSVYLFVRLFVRR